MKYAEVAVNSPVARRQGYYCYSIPTDLNIYIGQLVLVPFGPRILQGVVVKLSDYPSVEATKEIDSVISSDPLLSPIQVELAFWISKYYLSPLFDALALMLPPGFEQKPAVFFQVSPHSVDLSLLDSEQRDIVELCRSRGKVSLSELRRQYGKIKAEKVVEQLVRRRYLVRTEQLKGVRVKPKLVPYLKLNIKADEKEELINELRKSRANTQIAVIEWLSLQQGPVSLAELRKSVSFSSAAMASLKKRGIISVEKVEVRRDPMADLHIAPTSPPVFTAAQQNAWEAISRHLGGDDYGKGPSVFLLKGVTGSGKTEVYIKALAEVISYGKHGICLVPEIALTPQTIERFASRFPGRVAVFHSGLSPGERFDEWRRVASGDCDVVIGPRSALFTPQSDLGLIIIDEEHEWTYKQADKSPRYHARDVAIKLAELSDAAVILGSATPDVETFYRSQRGEYHLVELADRITPRGISPLPEVQVVDLRQELKAGNRSLISRSLYNEMSLALNKHEQIILFLNRRGTFTFIQCRDCDYVPTCRHCLAALNYHESAGKLICHHCHYSCRVPVTCPQCSGQRFKFLGIGTQRVEQETRRLFPRARILRWDSDAITGPKSHQSILSKFASNQADILIGTQMIAKGLDLPMVTVAGVINADIGLTLPDFRAGERTFQLACQIAGRAGRGLVAGKVIVQTYNPDHYAIRAVSRHDYTDFYDHEIAYRRQFGYPPFSQLARLIVSHTNANACQREAEKMERLLTAERDRQGFPDLRIIGPVPAFVQRVRGRYQWQIILRGRELSDFLAGISLPSGWIVDIDPVSVI